jgi:hypothetical protein
VIAASVEDEWKRLAGQFQTAHVLAHQVELHASGTGLLSRVFQCQFRAINGGHIESARCQPHGVRACAASQFKRPTRSEAGVRKNLRQFF